MGDLFEGLPPPSTEQAQKVEPSPAPAPLPPPPLKSALKRPKFEDSAAAPAPAIKSALKKPKFDDPAPAPAPALKSALKKPKFDDSAPVSALKSALKQSNSDGSNPPAAAAAPEKRLRFRTVEDAPEQQVLDAMKKIALHIKSPAKFSKASKLAVQLIQAGSVKPTNCDYFFSILESAMSCPTACTDQSIRADVHALFSAAQDADEGFSKSQRNQLAIWTIHAVVANDLFTDDSFVFFKTAAYLREAISELPVATESDDMDEAAALKAADESEPHHSETNEEESDPFGLDALLSTAAKKDTESKIRKEEDEEESKRFLRARREALVICLEIAARRYKITWCQTVIDILVKHAFDNVSKFTLKQREAIEKLWASIREQQARRKHGKSVTGKLDVNGFEWLQQKYAGEKISIRKAVGGSGDRKCQQWLG